MKDWNAEIDSRVKWIQDILVRSGKKGIIYGNSGGKDSAVVGTLCRMATPEVCGIIMPCDNNPEDAQHAELVAQTKGIQTMTIDIKPAFNAAKTLLSDVQGMALSNIKPRLRMIILYALAQSRGYLVAGTGNRSEFEVGYFTKWGDGAYDFNPIADLTATEVLELGQYLKVPQEILNKKPSAGLWPGQTDEDELGITYSRLDKFLLSGEADKEERALIMGKMAAAEHKKRLPQTYPS